MSEAKPFAYHNNHILWFASENKNWNGIPLYTHPPKHEAIEPTFWWLDVDDVVLPPKHDYTSAYLSCVYEGSHSIPLYTQAPITQAVVAAVIRKAAEVANDNFEDGVAKQILRLPHDDSALREMLRRAVDLSTEELTANEIVERVLSGSAD